MSYWLELLERLLVNKVNKMVNKKKKIICFGTFDILHPGHVYFLKESKKLGDFLVVVVARDVTVRKVRGRMGRNSEEKRKEKIEKLRVADEVMLGDERDPYKILDKVRPDIICLGYDQKVFTDDLKGELEKRRVEAKVVRMRAYKPKIYKSSKLMNYHS